MQNFSTDLNRLLIRNKMKIEIVFLLGGILLILNYQSVDSVVLPPYYLCYDTCETLIELKNDVCYELVDSSETGGGPNCKCQLLEQLYVAFCRRIEPIIPPTVSDFSPNLIPITKSTDFDGKTKPTEHSARKGPHSKNDGRRHPKQFNNQHLNKKN